MGRRVQWTNRRIKTLIKKILKYAREASKRSVEVTVNGKSIHVLGPRVASMEEFAQKSYHISADYIKTLSKKHPELDLAIKKVNETRNDMIVRFALQGAYDKTFAIFAMKNLAQWKDTPMIDQSNHQHYSFFEKMAERAGLLNGSRDNETILPESGTGSN